MRTFLLTLLLIFLAFPLRAADRVWTPETLPMVHLQDMRRYVCNPDGILSEAVTDSIDALLFRLEKQKGVESVVVAVQKVEDGDCYTFAINLGRKYGVGSKKQQSGLVVVLSTEDRKYYILTGYGLEGTLPDAVCKRVENRLMVPAFKKGDWDKGMLLGIKALSGYILGDESLTPDQQGDDEDDLVGLLVLGVFIIVFIIVILVSSARKCPRCGKKALTKSMEKFLYTKGGWDYYQVISTCKHCGYSESKVERREHQDNDDSGLLAAAAMGSILSHRGGGGFGGGFGGGSFGGGGFGGGGAGGSF